jgi:hypothetical protein
MAHSNTADPYDAVARALRSTQTSAVGNVSPGQRILRLDAVAPFSLSALRARGTRLSRDSRICFPVSVLRFSFFPAIERFLMSLPEIVKAAYELPPNAMKTATVDITLVYVHP